MEKNEEDVNDKSFESKITEAYEKGFNEKPEFILAANYVTKEAQKLKTKNEKEKAPLKENNNMEKNKENGEDYLEMV